LWGAHTLGPGKNKSRLADHDKKRRKRRLKVSLVQSSRKPGKGLLLAWKNQKKTQRRRVLKLTKVVGKLREDSGPNMNAAKQNGTIAAEQRFKLKIRGNTCTTE